jgi:hypothetical protein
MGTKDNKSTVPVFDAVQPGSNLPTYLKESCATVRIAVTGCTATSGYFCNNA